MCICRIKGLEKNLKNFGDETEHNGELERKRVFEIKRTKLDGRSKKLNQDTFFITENLQKGQNDFLKNPQKY